MYVSVKKCLGKRTCEFSAVALKIFFPRVSSLERNVIILGIKMCPHLHSSQRSFSQASSAVGVLETLSTVAAFNLRPPITKDYIP